PHSERAVPGGGPTATDVVPERCRPSTSSMETVDARTNPQRSDQSMRHARPGQSEPEADNPTKAMDVESYPSSAVKINRTATDGSPSPTRSTVATVNPDRVGHGSVSG